MHDWTMVIVHKTFPEYNKTVKDFPFVPQVGDQIDMSLAVAPSVIKVMYKFDEKQVLILVD